MRKMPSLSTTSKPTSLPPVGSVCAVCTTKTRPSYGPSSIPSAPISPYDSIPKFQGLLNLRVKIAGTSTFAIKIVLSPRLYLLAHFQSLTNAPVLLSRRTGLAVCLHFRRARTDSAVPLLQWVLAAERLPRRGDRPSHGRRIHRKKFTFLATARHHCVGLDCHRGFGIWLECIIEVGWHAASCSDPGEDYADLC